MSRNTKRPRNLSRREVFEYFLPAECPPIDCWRWQGSFYGVGYGKVSFGQKQMYAHRLAWELAHGSEIPNGVQIRHTCDNRWCVNPGHLVDGSFYDNMQDAIERDRFRHTSGHWNARLSVEQVRQIRELGAAGIRHETIAENFGVCRSAVTNIINRKSWRQVA